MIVIDNNNQTAFSALPDMTALLDVIFILLVFLLLTANAAPKALKVALPQDDQGVAQTIEADNQITVTIFPDGQRWGLQKRKFESWKAFEQALLAQVNAQQEPQIVVVGDKNTSLEKLLKLFTWLQSHHLTAAHMMMSRQALPVEKQP